MLRFSLGLSALLAHPDDPKPGGYCRDELLFTPFDVSAAGDDFEIREVLLSHLPLASGAPHTRGDIYVVMAMRADVSGPIPADAAAHLLAVWKRTPRVAFSAHTFDSFGLVGPSLLVGAPCRATTVRLQEHPLDGVHLVEVDHVHSRALKLLGHGSNFELMHMLRLCLVHEFAVSVVEHQEPS